MGFMLLVCTFVDNYSLAQSGDYELHVYDSALKKKILSLEKFKQEKDSENVIKILTDISDLYYTESQYASVQKYLLEAKRYVRRNSPCSESLSIELNLARLMYSIQEKPDALRLLEKNYNSVFSCGDKNLQFHIVYYMGVVTYEMGMIDSAKMYLEQSLKLAKELGKIKSMSQCHSIFGEMYLYRVQNNKLAKLHIDSALALAKVSGDKNAIAFAHIKMAMFYTKVKMYDSSLVHLDTSEMLFTEMGSLRDIVYVRHNRADIYRNQNNSELTFQTLISLFGLYDTIFKREKLADVSHYRTLYETEKKEQENLQLNIQNQKVINRNKSLVAYFSLGVAVLVLIGTFIFWRNRKKSLLERERLQQKMLNAIIEAEEKERVRIAKDLHDGVGQLITMARLHVSSIEDEVPEEINHSITTSLKTLDNAIEEVRNVSHDLMPGVLVELGLVAALRQLAGNLNTSGLIAVHLRCETEHERFHRSSELALYRVVQEVTNNMIRHSEATEIHILLKEKEGSLLLKISDNGKGFDVSLIPQSKGIGWRNILSRIQMINGKVDIRSGAISGTEVEVKLPIQNSN